MNKFLNKKDINKYNNYKMMNLRKQLFYLSIMKIIFNSYKTN